MNKMHAVLSTLIVAGLSAHAFAAEVTCTSANGRYAECPLPGGGDIVMKQQLSKTDCIKDLTWGETAGGVYVKGGCRAIFETMSLAPPSRHSARAASTQVTCASANGKYTECPLAGSGDIVMKLQLSKTDCIKDRTWGETAEGVYVKDGCRATFETMSSGGRSRGGNGFEDLIGAKAAGGESDLQARGYEFVSVDTVKDSKVSHWWTPGRDSCIEVTTRDGRYSDIRDVGKGECY